VVLKILIVKTSSMGDIVHTMPAVSDIARHRPDAQIHWLVEAPFAALPAMHPAVHKVHSIAWRKWRKKLFESQTREAIKRSRSELRAEYFDLILDAQGLIKSAFFAGQARGLRAGYDWKSAREPLASVWYQQVATIDKSLHAVQRTRLLAAAHLGYRAEGEPDFSMRMPDPTWLPPTTKPYARPYVVFIPGASREEKLWPEERWVELAQHIATRGVEIVWLWGSKEEGSRCVKLAAQSDGEIPPFLSVQDASALLARAKAVVGLDTGFSHIAAAFGVPTVGIYCDHEPGLVGIMGTGFVASVGGRGEMPDLARIKRLADDALTHSTVRKVVK
jgi:heptosyltransferase I